MTATRTHALDVAEDLARRALATPVASADAEDARWLSLGTCARMLLHVRAPYGDELLEAMDAAPPDESRLGILTVGTLAELRARRAQRRGDLGATLAGLETAVAAVEASGSAYLAEAYWIHLALTLFEIGDLARAEDLARRALASARRNGSGTLAYAAFAVMTVLLARGEVAEARAIHDATTWTTTEARMSAWAAWARSSLHEAEGDRGGALEAARAAVDAGGAPYVRATMLGHLAALLLEAGRADEAVAPVEEAATHALRTGEVISDEQRLHLTRVRALRATGAGDAADAALSAARAMVARRAATLDEGRRALYLDQPRARAILGGDERGPAR